MRTNSRISKSQFLFSIAYTLLLFCSFYQTTTFKALQDIGFFYNICRVLAAAIILFKCVCFDKYTLKELCFVLVILLIGLLSYLFSKRGDFLDVILLIAGSANLDECKLVKQYYVIALSFLLVAFVCSQAGIIIDYTTVRSIGTGAFNSERHGFGVVYATDFAAHILFIYISYYYLKYGLRQIKIWDYVVCFLLVYFLDAFCDARLTELMLVFSLLLFTVAYSSSKLPERHFFEKIVENAVSLCAIFTILITALYDASNPIWVAFDSSFMSNRLKISNRVLKTYGVPVLGQSIVMQGHGFKINGFDPQIGITYLDSSYIQLLLLYGIVSTILIIMIYAIFSKKVVKNDDRALKMILLILAVSSIINQYLFSIAYNPFAIVAGTYSIDRLRNK